MADRSSRDRDGVIDAYAEAFARFTGNGGGHGPAELLARRREAFDRFATAGFPTSRDEEWRFTPLTPLARIREMVLHHHEFFDGSGYPQALSGDTIPLGARIIAIADAYDTITSDRTYKKARTATDALAELERCANAQFDGAIVELFVRTMRTLPNPIIEVAATTGAQRSS